MGLIHLIKLVGLRLTYIILYVSLNMTRTQHVTFKMSNFDTTLKPKLTNSLTLTQHKINSLRLKGLTQLFIFVELELTYIILYSFLNTTQIWYVNMNWYLY